MENKQTDALHDEMRHLMEEARVILPGIQALFGFQTIAVFNERFTELPFYVKGCHLAGLGMVIMAVALIMTPAAYYRTVGPENVSTHMIRLSTFLIRSALAPLACGLTLDIFTVIFTATDEVGGSLLGAFAALLVLVGLWYVLPLMGRRRVRTRGAR